MKDIIKESFRDLLANRQILVLLCLSIVFAFVFSIYLCFSIHSSELQLVSHYSAFGETHLYRDQWFYLFSFVIFQIIIAFINAVISVKLLTVKGRSIAIMFSWLGVLLLILGWLMALAIINVWIPI